MLRRPTTIFAHVEKCTHRHVRIELLHSQNSQSHQQIRKMATVKDSVPHLARTAADERQRTLYSASIGRIEQVNSKIRLLRLYLDGDQVRTLSQSRTDELGPSISIRHVSVELLCCND